MSFRLHTYMYTTLLLLLPARVLATPRNGSSAVPSSSAQYSPASEMFLAEAASAVTVLQRRWYMAGAGGSWVGRGPGAGTGKYDQCTANASQSCKCNGIQGNWERANIVEALCSYQIATGSSDYDDAIANAWPQVGFEINSAAPFPCDPNAPGDHQSMPHGNPGWPYYDDILWWALAYLRAADMYSVRGDEQLSATMTKRSADIFDHVAARGWNDSAAACGGGIWWSTDEGYKNAIANELFFATAAKLGKVDWARRVWSWFAGSGMINNQSLVNDGLSLSNCKNNGRETYTYNQGVILGGLCWLHQRTGDRALLTIGSNIIDAVLRYLTDSNGVLKEAYVCGDQSLFKGIFVRYVRYFINGAPKGALPATKLNRWRGFLTTNAESLWRSQGPEGTFPLWWGAGTSPIFPTAAVNLQAAAIDAFVAAATPSSSRPASSSSPFPASTQTDDLACSGVGKKVGDRCVCRTRFAGADCQQEISWLKYYSTWTALGRSVVIMTSTSHFLSSAEGSPVVHGVSHVSGDEAWTVESCGTGIGLVDSHGRWLAIDTTSASSGSVVAAVTTVNTTVVNCSDAESPAAFELPPTKLFNNSDTDEAVLLISKLPTHSSSGDSSTTKRWYVAVDSNSAGEEALVAVSVTPEQARNTSAYDEAGVWFHVRLQDHCQSLD